MPDSNRRFLLRSRPEGRITEDTFELAEEAVPEINDGEAWLLNAHISEYSHGNIMNHAPVRKRKLLLHKWEIDRIRGWMEQKGLALIPLQLYFRRGFAKLELGLGKGKKLYDKRETELRRIVDRETRAQLKQRNQ